MYSALFLDSKKCQIRHLKNQNKMRKIINERGEEVLSIGEWDSPARMQQKYPDTISKLISFVITGYKYDYQILKKLAVEFNVVDSDIHVLLSAVHFYTTEIFKNEVYANE